jgi:NAD+ kinase
MIGIIAHSAKADARDVLRALVRALEKTGLDYDVESATAELLGRKSELDERALAKQSNILVVLGGDGTILRVVHRLGTDLRPVFGINIGSLGFLTCVGPSEIDRAVESLFSEDYILSPRSLMLVELSGSNRRERFHAVNDVVIGRGQHSELIKVEVSIDGSVLTEYNADGLIVATPTGSTAYSLSAGGPILMPESGVFVVTPICPHVLTNRSTVVSDRSVIEARFSQRGKEVYLTVDGQKSIALAEGDHLKIYKSGRQLRLAMLPEKLFPEVLRQKLKWSGSNV